jgi:hypothetical protein
MGFCICFQTKKMGLKLYQEQKTTVHNTPPFMKHFYIQFYLSRNRYQSFLFQTKLGNICVSERHVSYLASINCEGILSIGINGDLYPFKKKSSASKELDPEINGSAYLSSLSSLTPRTSSKS